MEKEVQTFIDAEKAAKDLVTTLQQLYEEASSYQTAKEELEETRTKLVNFIDSARENAKGIEVVMQKLLDIGGPEIFNKLSEILDRVGGIKTETINQINRIKLLVLITLGVSFVALIISIVAVVQ